MCVESTKDWGDILSALATPTLAVFAIYIAWRQWRTAELKRKQDLFDKRYEVYGQVIEFFNSMSTPEYFSVDAIMKLHIPRRKAFFLFNEEISNYITELISRSATLHVKTLSLRQGMVDENERNQISNLILETLGFFEKEQKTIDKKFEKFLAIREK